VKIKKMYHIRNMIKHLYDFQGHMKVSPDVVAEFYRRLGFNPSKKIKIKH